jgi:WD40 repeat protein
MGEPVEVFHLGSGKKLYSLERTVGGTDGIAFSRDSSMIATADADTQVRIYDVSNGKLIARNTDLLLEPFALEFGLDRKRLFVGGADKVVNVIDSSTGKLIRRLAKVDEPIAFLQLSPDGHHLACGLLNATGMNQPAPVLVWNTESGNKQLEWLPPRVPLGGSWTRDGRMFAVTAESDTLRFWKIQ